MSQDIYTDNIIVFNRVVVGVFLLITLLLGLRVKRAKSLQEYALAGRSLNAGVLTLSLLATFVTIGDIVHPYYTADCGILEMRESLFLVIVFFLVGFFLAPKMRHFKKCMTVGDVMGKLYGKSAQLITGLLGIGFFLFITSAQMRELGKLTAHILDTTPEKAIIVISFFVILYSTVGGMRSVAVTDVLQFITLVVALVVFTNILLYKVGGLENLFKSLPADKLTLGSNPEFKSKMTSGIFYGLFPTFLLSPPVIQRMLMIKKKKEAQNMFFTGGFLYGAIRILFALIGLSALVYYKDTPEKIGEELFSNLLQDVLYNNPWMQLFITLGLVCIIISTIDSYIVSMSVSFIRDFVSTEKEEGKNPRKIKYIAQLLTMLSGMIAMALGIFWKDPFGEMSYYYTVVLSAVFLVPFIFGVLGFRVKKNSFWAFVVPYLIVYTAVLLLWGKEGKYYNFFIGLGAGVISYLGYHYFSNDGFVTLDRTATFFIVKKWNPSRRKFAKKIGNILSTPLRLARIAREKINIYGSEPFFFTLFILLTNMIVSVADKDHLLNAFYLTGCVNLIGSILCIGLLLRSLWSPVLARRFFPLYWFFTIFYCVPFSHILLFLEDASNPISVIKLTVMLFLMVLLVDWRSFFTLLILGLIAALALHHMIGTPAALPLSITAKFQIAWGSLPVLIIGLLFARKREASSHYKKKALIESRKRIKNRLHVAEDIHQQLVTALDPKSSTMQEAQSIADKLKRGTLPKEEAYKLEKILSFLTDVQKKSKDYLPLVPQKITWEKLLKMLFEELESLQIHDRIDFLINLPEGEKEIVADLSYMHRLLANAVQHIVERKKHNNIVCYIDKAFLKYDLANSTQAIPAYRIVVADREMLPRLPGLYTPLHAMPFVDMEITSIRENYRITRAHYGHMDYEVSDRYMVQTYVVPHDICEVRPKVTSFIDEDLDLTTTLQSPEDKAFLQAASCKRLPMPIIKKALKTCKYYHRSQQRKDGTPYYLHPLAVASILLEYTSDVDVIVASLLHDILEETPYTLYQIEVFFNSSVAKVVNEVSNVYNKASRKRKIDKQEEFDNMLATVDRRSLLVKLADRLHNMRTLAYHKREKRVQIAQETLAFFVPIAKHLGHIAITDELLALCDEYLADEPKEPIHYLVEAET